MFPSERASIEQAEADAEISRLYDGTHYEHDIAAGTAVGHAIGRVYAARGRCDGSTKGAEGDRGGVGTGPSPSARPSAG